MAEGILKTCRKCGMKKHRRAGFHQEAGRADGRKTICKSCMRAEDVARAAQDCEQTVRKVAEACGVTDAELRAAIMLVARDGA